MQDQYTGQAGTFIVDPISGTRMPYDEWVAQEAAKAAEEKPKKDKKHTTEEAI
ncbi:MAG: hypothetical protein Q8M20_18160 [Rhodocyclaceae bacterium]|nr:hypothetical protein [Rhodocyclaceae bacterium]